MSNLQAGGPPLVGCSRLLIQYILSYTPYIETVSSMRHAVVTRDPFNMGNVILQFQIMLSQH
jgi:hypothetical protein